MVIGNVTLMLNKLSIYYILVISIKQEIMYGIHRYVNYMNVLIHICLTVNMYIFSESIGVGAQEAL